MKTWNHKFHGLPSCSFVEGHLRKYRNKRIRFLLLHPEKYGFVTKPALIGKNRTKVQLNPNRPIYVNAIYSQLFKKSKFEGTVGDWGMRVKPEDTTFRFVFRDVVFEQDGEQYVYPFGINFRLRPRAANKTKSWGFDMNDIGSCPLVNELRLVDILKMMELYMVSY